MKTGSARMGSRGKTTGSFCSFFFRREKQLFFCISYLQNREEFINIISVLALNNDEC